MTDMNEARVQKIAQKQECDKERTAMNEARVQKIAQKLVSRELPELWLIYRDDVKPPAVTVKMPDGKRMKFIPKGSFSGAAMWWPNDRKTSLIDYFQLIGEWDQNPTKPFRLKVKMGLAGGHIRKEVPFVVRPGKDTAKSIEDAIKRTVPNVIERYLNRFGDDILEQIARTNQALADYYSKPGYLKIDH